MEQKHTKSKYVSAIPILLALGSLFFMGCAQKAEEAPVPKATAVITAAPQQVDFAVAATETPVPLTPTPVPTATPDPYLVGTEPVVYREGFFHVPIQAALAARITGMSYPEDPAACPVTLEELRYLRIRYVDFAGAEHVGELIVHHELAEEVLEIFAALYDARYPLTSVRLVDDFGEPGDDTRSMAADNTSSFCCRRVTGSKHYSLHSYGMAIDINPMRNPYIRKDGSVSPENGTPYADRTREFAGKIDEKDLAYRLFTERGWNWGGYFSSEKDYQHFSKDLR